MPEGPEIRREADQVAKAIVGEVAKDVFFAFERLKPYEHILTGQEVSTVTTRGKAMLTRFEGGLSVYSHNQLYGRWYVQRAGTEPKTRRQLRFAVQAAEQRAMLYSASDIEVLDAEAEREHKFLSRLGPDVLSESPSPDVLVARLLDRRFRSRQLGALLLDQGFVAGLGNYLRAEILFEARLHPRLKAQDCDPTALEMLVDRILAVTARAYRTRGITLDQDRVAALKAAGAKRSAYRFWAYGRSGAPCRRCDRPIEVNTLGGRNCFWCPSCQPEPRAS